MKRLVRGVTLLMMGAGIGLGGCSNDGEGSPPGEPSAAPTFQSRTLGVFEAGAQRLNIVEDVPGEVVFRETGPIGMAPLVDSSDSNLTLMDLYRKLEPKLTAPVRADVLSALAAADGRAAKKVKVPKSARTPVPDPGESKALGEPVPNFFAIDYATDNSWFRQNFCKPGTFCETWVYWAKSGGKTEIENWSCTVLNAAETGYAIATLRAKHCAGLCFGSTWEVASQVDVQPRQYVRWQAAKRNDMYLGRNCWGEGVKGAYVSVGMFWETPAPAVRPPPAPSCGSNIVRAHTANCRNADGSLSSILQMCGDGCGSTPQAAADNAMASLRSQVCLGTGPGCCEVRIDTNFNWCGY